MEYEQQGRLQLCVYLDGSRCIQVPLKRFAADKPAGTGRLKIEIHPWMTAKGYIRDPEFPLAPTKIAP